jgi:CSLREA domain-containing protein
VTNSTFSGNYADFSNENFGGGIANGGTLTVSNSTLSGNSAVSAGGIANGGSYFQSGTLTVASSTISGNTSNELGGGIYNGYNGTLTMSNSTVSGNSLSGFGGGIFNLATLTMSNSIVAGNAAGEDGYGDIYGTYTDNGGNQASSNSSPTSTIAINLAPLGSYGGPTQTMVPLPGSPAICAGLAANIPTGVTADQRGYPNINTTYTGYSSGSPCVDSGAAQSHYTSVQFVQQPTNILVNSAISPSPTVQVLETNTNLSTNNTDAVNGIPITLSYSGGPGEISGTLMETTTGGLATFGGLTPNTVGTGFDFSTSVTVVAGTTLTATSNPFNVNPTTVQVTVGTSPVGLSFSVDGTPYTTSQTLTWAIGSNHTLTTAAQSGAGTQYSFTGWSDGTTTLTDSVTASTGTTAYTAEFNPLAYVLNVSSSNTSYGTVTAPAVSGGYDAAGSQVTLTAVVNAGYYFAGWTGSADIANPNSASTAITMNGPEMVTANFAPIPSFVVTTATDDLTGAASNCTPSGPNCSLRDALAAAAAAGAGNITFSSSAFPSATTIQLGSGGTLNLPSNTTITGLTAGSGITLANLVTVSGGGYYNRFSVFTVNSGVTGAAIANLIITNGFVDIYDGGGINNAGTLTVSGSTISGNSGYVFGGGIYNNGGTLAVSNSTVSGNIVFEGSGGGIANLGTLTVSNSTFSGNASEGNSGGGIFNGGTLTVRNSTFSSNSASGGGASGGGIFNGGTLTLSNSIVAGNTTSVEAVYADISGSYTDNGGNQAGNYASPTSTIAINLAPLGNYGGPTQTMVPLPGSPAICTGLAANILAGVTTDQRGYPNTNTTYTGYSSGSPCVDSGAVQSQYTSVQFVQQPTSTVVNSTISPSPTVQVLETNTNLSTNNTDAVNGIPITLSYSGGSREISGTLMETTASGLATFGGLKPNTLGTSFKLSTSVTVVAGTTLTATSNPFKVTTPLGSTTAVALTSGTNPSSAEQSLTFTATVTAGATGSVTFYSRSVGGNCTSSGNTQIGSPQPLIGGLASITTSTLPVGSGSVLGCYGGDSNYNSSYGYAAQKVNALGSATAVTLTAGTNPSTAGESLTFTATVTAGATGSVIFYGRTVGGNCASAGNTQIGSPQPLVGGLASITTTSLPVGSGYVLGCYGGDSNYNSSYGYAAQKVNALGSATAVALTSGTNPSSAEQSLTFTATVTAGATGNVTFYSRTVGGNCSSSGNTQIGSPQPLSNGSASVTTSSLPVGSGYVLGCYGGDSSYNSSYGYAAQKVNALGSATAVALTSGTNPSTAGGSLTFTATVTAGATGSVTFYSRTVGGNCTSSGNTQIGSPQPLSGGLASITTTSLPVGSGYVLGCYGGDSNYNSSYGYAAQKVNALGSTTAVTLNSGTNPSIAGGSLTFTATVTAGATGSVTFYSRTVGGNCTTAGNTQIGSPQPLVGGLASITTTSLPVGSGYVLGCYGGDSNYNSSYGYAAQKVNALGSATAVTLTSGTNPSTAGESLTFMATVTAGATGNVTFYSRTVGGNCTTAGNTQIGSPQPLVGGLASITTSSLPVGSGYVLGCYGGDSNYNSSYGYAAQKVNP